MALNCTGRRNASDAAAPLPILTDRSNLVGIAFLNTSGGLSTQCIERIDP